MSNRFMHLNIPDQWNHYWTKYPEGYTILESLLNWVGQVDNMVDQLNLNTEQVQVLQEKIESEVAQFKSYVDSKLSFSNIEKILSDWFNSGKLSSLLNDLVGVSVYVTDSTVQNNVPVNVPYTTDKLRRMQNVLLSQFYRKLNNSELVTVECMGDSTTYGHDTTSADVRPPASDKTLDMTQTYTITQASKTYPEALLSYLTQINRPNVSVINRGFSGDTTKLSYSRWVNTVNSHLSLIMFGLNDTANSIQEFRDNYIKIIARQILRGSAVVLLTPITTTFPKQDIEDYTRVVYDLADMFGVPVIEMDKLVANYTKDIHSDDFHLNGTGYNMVGARLTALFMGNGASNPLFVSGGDKLLTRRQLDSCFMTRGAVSSSTGANDTPDETYSGLGISARLTPDGATIYYTFYTEEDDLIIVPDIFKSGIASLEVELDFNTIKPKNSLSYAIGKGNTSNSDDVITKFTHDSDSIFTKNALKSKSDKRYIHVVKKGWHTLSIKKISGAGEFYVRGLEFLSYNDYVKLFQKPYFDFPIDVGVSNYKLKATDLCDVLGIAPIDSADSKAYWKSIPVTLSIYVYNECVLTYKFMVGNLQSATGWEYATTGQTYNFKDTPITRTFTGTSYDPATKELTINFGGSTTHYAHGVITIG